MTGINWHRKPDNLILDRYPDLLYLLNQAPEGMQLLNAYKSFLETPMLFNSWRPIEPIERLAANAATVRASASIFDHFVVHPRRVNPHPPTLADEDFPKDMQGMYDKVQECLDTLEMRELLRHHGVAHIYDIRGTTNNKRLYTHHYHFESLCHPTSTRMLLVKTTQAITRGIVSLRAEIDEAKQQADEPAAFCLRELGPAMLERMETMRNDLQTIQESLRKEREENIAPFPKSAEVPQREVDVNELQRASHQGKVVFVDFVNRMRQI